MAKRKGRKHPGVTVIKPNPKTQAGWRMRWEDPDSHKTVTKTFDHDLQGPRADGQRHEEAYKKSVKLARRRRELEEGRATKRTNRGVKETLDLYFAEHPDLRGRTLKEYRKVTDQLVAWCDANGIKNADGLDRTALYEFRGHRINAPMRKAVKGGKRGERVSTGNRRGPRTINKEMTGIATVLNYLVKREAFSQLRLEDVAYATEFYNAKPKPHQIRAARPLNVREIELLLEACIEHDEQTFSMTREERASGDKGRTLRHEPIGPLVAFLLLTGMRAGEAVDAGGEGRPVEWSDVDFDRAVIRIGEWSKTGNPRDVTMAESPMLQRILDAQHEVTGGTGPIWPMTYQQAEKARQRLIKEHGAPEAFSPQALRKSCVSFLASSPSVYGAASVFLAAKRTGHSVAVCEKHYANAVKVADPDATTIEGAMGVEELLDQIAEDLEAIEVAA